MIRIALLAVTITCSNILIAQSPIEVTAPVSRIFSPIGFDTNDLAEVVLTGTLPTSCHQLGGSTFTVDRDKKVIRINLTGYKVERGICIDLSAPYQHTVKLGHLPAGDYDVRLVQTPTIKSHLPVKPSNSAGRDDHLYLPVEFADLILADGSQKIYLSGRYPKIKQGCMALERTIVRVHDNDQILVQPIAKILDEDSCQEGQPRTFHHLVAMPTAFAGEGLLHVRGLNGTSYNKIVVGQP